MTKRFNGNRPLPDYDRLHQLFTYNPLTGAFRYKKSGKAMNQKSNHPVVRVDGINFLVSRLVFKMHTGEDPGFLVIDHINSYSNKFANLRACTQRDNMGNKAIQKNNSTGYKGVTSLGKKFVAHCNNKHLGTFSCPYEAHLAYCEAAVKTFGDYARFE